MMRKRKTTNEIIVLPTQDSMSMFVPALIAEHGKRSAKSFLSFFIDNIRNKNTRAAYFRAAKRFFSWCDQKNLQLELIESFHVSAYIEELGTTHAVPSVKQHLAALRMLYGWLVIKQIVPANPTHSVRGPSLRVTTGKTPALDETEAQLLLSSIPTDSLIGLRDRALIALMTYTFSRVSAALAMNVEDYFPKGKRYWVRLHEKGGRYHEMPAHHKLEEYLDAYIEAAGIENDRSTPLFRSAFGKTGLLTDKQLQRRNALQMVRKRARQAEILTQTMNHTFRTTGITNYLTNGGSITEAQKMAAHADCRTTKLYDKRNDQVSLDEVEKISI